MHDQPTTALADLFGAVTAHLRGDDAGVRVVLAAAVAHRDADQLPYAAVMTAGEYLREAAEERAMPAARMVAVLRVAQASLAATDRPNPEGLILAGVGAYLRGAGALWDDTELRRMLAADPYATWLAAVRVVAAALTWHARDCDTDPVELAHSTCLLLAGRACPAPPRATA